MRNLPIKKKLKADFLEYGSHECPLLRIYGIDDNGFESLDKLFLNASCLSGWSYEIMPGNIFIDTEVRISIISGNSNVGVVKNGDALCFNWILTKEKWKVVHGLTIPFFLSEKNGIFQWLTGNEARYGLDIGRISVLLTKNHDGSW